MSKCSRGTKQSSTPYATSDDFCQVFHEEMNRLYLLSWLLTTDYESAEQCFVLAFEDSIKGTPVFKEWAKSWARRAIIQNAVRLSVPSQTNPNHIANSAQPADLMNTPSEIAAILSLPTFERFTFVLSVLEHYSDQECSLLLRCTRREVRAARAGALQRIATIESHKFGFADSPKVRMDKHLNITDRVGKGFEDYL